MPDSPERPLALPALHLAARHLAAGQPDEARRILAALVDEAPAYAAAHALLARAHESAGDAAAALASWQRAAFLVPASPLVAREHARLAQTLNPEPEAAAGAPPGRSREVDVLPDPRGPHAEENAPSPAQASAAEAGHATAGSTAPERAEEAGADERANRRSLVPGQTTPDAPPPEPAAAAEGPSTGTESAAVSADDVPTDDGPGSRSPEDAPESSPGTYAVADELESLIESLSNAPRIRPDPAFEGPAVSFAEGEADEVLSETLARIYAAQRQYARAAYIYEKLAAQRPAQADELRAKAVEMRRLG
ncbi:MAG: tetratricopeptide repeat protein [Rubricoccaceae bacterium]